MSLPVGSVLAMEVRFTKNGALYDPVPAPTVTEASYPDGTVLSGLPLAMTRARTGVYNADVFSGAQSTMVGTYSAWATTSDLTVDQLLGIVPYIWPEVGVSSVSALAAQAQTDVQSALAAQGYTTARAAFLDVLNGIVVAVQSGLATLANQTTLLARLGAITGSGANTLKGYIQALASKVATLPSDIGGTFAPATDSTEAIADALANAGGDPWATAQPGAYGTDTFGGLIATDLPAILGYAARIGSVALTWNSPAFNVPTRPIVAGRTYNSAYGNALTFSVTNLTIDLTGPAITTSLNVHVNGADVALDGTADTADTGHVNIDGAVTATWGPQAGAQPLRYPAELVVYDGTTAIDISYGFMYVVAGVNNS